MPYYDTIAEDLARAKAILARLAKPEHTPPTWVVGMDVRAAYKLLESFIAEIERLQPRLADAERRAGSILQQFEDQQDRTATLGEELLQLQTRLAAKDEELLKANEKVEALRETAMELEREVARLKQRPCEVCGWRSKAEYDAHPDRAECTCNGGEQGDGLVSLPHEPGCARYRG